MSKCIEFWYSLVSPYAYVCAMRMDSLIADAGLVVERQPMALMPIYQRLGWKVNPFADYPYKLEYVWRDVERLSGEYGLPFRTPDRFPQDALPGTRIALVGRDDGWMWDFSKRLFKANFQDGADIALDDTLERILYDMGLDAKAVMLRSRSREIEVLLESQTDSAMQKGVFGAPFFLVNGERFWGNDRLEQAIAWAAEKDPVAVNK